MPEHTTPDLCVRVKKLHPVWDEFPLAPATAHSAGVDLRACLDVPFLDIPPGGRAAVPAGLAIEPDTDRVAGFVFSRSGLGARDGLTVAQGVGVIDPDYRGEIVVWLLNTSSEPRRVSRGERVAQLVFLPVARPVFAFVDELSDTARGGGGFGHTGSL